MKRETIKIEDVRGGHERYTVDVDFMLSEAKKVGVYGVAVYHSILMRSSLGQGANVWDIAQELGISRGSVQKALHVLGKYGLIRLDGNVCRIMPLDR